MDPHSSLSNYVVLTTCNAVYLKAFDLPNGFWVPYPKQLKLIPTFNKKTVGEKRAIVVFFAIAGEGIFCHCRRRCLFMDKNLRVNELSQLMKYRRKKIS